MEEKGLSYDFERLIELVDDYCKRKRISKNQFLSNSEISKTTYYSIAKKQQDRISNMMLKRFATALEIPYSALVCQIVKETDEDFIGNTLEMFFSLSEQDQRTVNELIKKLYHKS